MVISTSKTKGKTHHLQWVRWRKCYELRELWTVVFYLQERCWKASLHVVISSHSRRWSDTAYKLQQVWAHLWVKYNEVHQSPFFNFNNLSSTLTWMAGNYIGSHGGKFAAKKSAKHLTKGYYDYYGACWKVELYSMHLFHITHKLIKVQMFFL